MKPPSHHIIHFNSADVTAQPGRVSQGTDLARRTCVEVVIWRVPSATIGRAASAEERWCLSRCTCTLGGNWQFGTFARSKRTVCAAPSEREAALPHVVHRRLTDLPAHLARTFFALLLLPDQVISFFDFDQFLSGPSREAGGAAVTFRRRFRCG